MKTEKELRKLFFKNTNAHIEISYSETVPVMSVEAFIESMAELNFCNNEVVSERTLDINICAALIKSMPLDQAIQIMKSDITRLPPTQVIEGELVVTYVR
ncbi:MAG: hypothetical protein HN704_18295 [Bacteroidetes bacterium]|jgi:hypothetical protein|nr:hypothetical protein [Bacteroidota bacterium]MBT7493554.1 hypothetical protein [Bacteroidota bacterium]